MNKLILGLAIFSASTSLSFATNNAATDCPPVEMMKNVTFVKAGRGFMGDGWGMRSQKFDFQNKQWVAGFMVSIPDAKDKQDALVKGNEMYHTIVQFSAPIIEPVPVGFIQCRYTAEGLPYEVTAVTGDIDS